MAIDQTITPLPIPPSSGDPVNFRTRADAFVAALVQFVTQLNVFRTQANDTEININAKEASAVGAANIASAAANFQGEWTSKGYILGQSVSSGSETYMCKLTHATGFAVTNTTYWQPTGLAAIISESTAKTVPVDADLIGIADSVSSFSLKKLTLANLKAMIFASSALTGTPTAPTATAGTNTTQIATTANVYTSSLGWGQTWQDVTASRALSTTYTNTTGKPIQIIIKSNYTLGASVYLTVGGIAVADAQVQTGTSSNGWVSAIVPSGTTYSVTMANTAILKWSELR